jgi:hypothetical protein
MVGGIELDGPDGEPAVGLICNADHDVFADVARRLRKRGVAVRFFDPGTEVPTAAIESLSLLMNKKVDPNSFSALARAESRGVPTWNGTTTMVLGARLVGYAVLEAAGCTVPPVAFDPPEADYVAKTQWDWHFEPDPERDGEGDFYQRLVPTEPIDYKYYAVDTGEEVVVRVLRATSKLYGEKEYLDLIDPDPRAAEQVRRVVRRTDSQAIGVDFVRSGDEYVAVDVNPAMSFRESGMEPELVRSVLARLHESSERARADASTAI